MRTLLKIIYLLSISCFSLEASDKPSLQDLEKRIQDYHIQLIQAIPREIKKELLEIKKYDDMLGLSLKSQTWLAAQFIDIVEIANNLKKISPSFIADDVNQLMRQTLIDTLHNKPLKINLKINDVETYWAEAAFPKFNKSPIGLNIVEWNWQLPNSKRKHGIIHVGIDTKTRQFLCFERTIGYYYPEGTLLEKIRKEFIKN